MDHDCPEPEELLPPLQVARPETGIEIRNLVDVVAGFRGINDRIISTAGKIATSPLFIYGFLLLLVGWTGTTFYRHAFGLPTIDDPRGFPVMSFAISVVWFVVSVFILIGQQRSERWERVRAEEDFQLARKTDADTNAMFTYLKEIAARQDAMMQSVSTRQRHIIAVEEQIRDAVRVMNETTVGMLEIMVKAFGERACLLTDGRTGSELEELIAEVGRRMIERRTKENKDADTSPDNPE